MPKQGGLGQRFFVGGYDLSGDVGAVQTARGIRNLLEVPGLDKSAMERIVGRRDGEISFNSWYNPTVDQQHTALKDLPTGDRDVMYCDGALVGNPAACLHGKQINYDWNLGNDGSLQASIQALANEFGLEWCKQLTAGLRTDGSATNGASVDDAAATAFGASAYLIMRSFAGTSCVVKIQDSADNSSFADVTGLTFATITVNTPQGQRLETALTATLRRYVRVVTTGTFSNIQFAVAYCRYLAARD